MIKKRLSPKFLLESGLLFQINRTLLHPLGLALEVIVDEKTGEVKFGEIWDCRDEFAGLLFSKETLREGYKKYKEYLRREGEQKIKERETQLGYIIQTNKEGKGGD